MNAGRVVKLRIIIIIIIQRFSRGLYFHKSQYGRRIGKQANGARARACDSPGAAGDVPAWWSRGGANLLKFFHRLLYFIRLSFASRLT